MSKTILRNDSEHKVSVPKGAKVAEGKRTQPKGKVQDSAAVAPARRIRPVKMELPEPPPVVPQSIAARKPRAKAKLADQVLPPVVDSPVVTRKPAAPQVTAQPPLDEKDLWEKDSPVMRRMNLLRARNAQISEQIQRLKQASSTGGQRK
jgi:hypothetical protein